MTPAQEAEYALAYGSSRRNLSTEAQAEYDRLKLEVANGRSGQQHTDPAVPPGKTRNETAAERYARQSRNAVVFIAVVIAVGLVVSLIIGIVAVVALHGLSPVAGGG